MTTSTCEATAQAVAVNLEVPTVSHTSGGKRLAQPLSTTCRHNVAGANASPVTATQTAHMAWRRGDVAGDVAVAFEHTVALALAQALPN